MGYYNGKKVLSAVKVEPCLNLNEGGDVENNTLFIDEYVGAIITLGGVSYKHCVSSDEAKQMNEGGTPLTQQALLLPSKQIVAYSSSHSPSIVRFGNNFELHYENPTTGINTIRLDTATTGELSLQHVEGSNPTLLRAYIINDGEGKWVLFFNLINE